MAGCLYVCLCECVCLSIIWYIYSFTYLSICHNCVCVFKWMGVYNDMDTLYRGRVNPRLFCHFCGSNKVLFIWSVDLGSCSWSGERITRRNGIGSTFVWICHPVRICLCIFFVGVSFQLLYLSSDYLFTRFRLICSEGGYHAVYINNVIARRLISYLIYCIHIGSECFFKLFSMWKKKSK